MEEILRSIFTRLANVNGAKTSCFPPQNEVTLLVKSLKKARLKMNNVLRVIFTIPQNVTHRHAALRALQLHSDGCYLTGETNTTYNQGGGSRGGTRK